MRREEVAGEGEVGGGEDGEGLDEDVGDGLVAREVRVELVSLAVLVTFLFSFYICGICGGEGSDRANNMEFFNPAIQRAMASWVLQVIGNVILFDIITDAFPQLSTPFA